MENFTPVSALIGGVIIGGAATLLLLLNGRVAGVSGILGGLLAPQRGDALWRAALLAGLVIGGFIWAQAATATVPTIDAGLPLLVIGGFLTGFGARLGGGCASGHGVCGLGRLSVRSFVAVGTFMLTCGVTVYLMRHVIGG
jgi:uncharacterized membrane protein YedE/YeeE